MRRFQAMLAALVLAVVTSAGMIIYASDHIERNHRAVGVWTSDSKYLSRKGTSANLDENTMLIFGSSEFEHGAESGYHITRQFRETSLKPFLIGKNQCQSLLHAMNLASIEPTMKNRKVVLIASPQWFQRKRVIPASFATRFSMDNFMGMLENETLSQDIKERMVQRCQYLLEKSDENAYRKVTYFAERRNDQAGSYRDVLYRAGERWNHWQQGISFVLHAAADRIPTSEDPVSKGSPEYDWEQMYKDAEKEAMKKSANEFCMDNTFYRLNKGRILSSKGRSANRPFFENAQEYQDYELFLDVCRELGLEVLVIVPGNNRYWTDYTGYPRDTIEQTYQKMIQVAESHGAEVCDLTSYEKEPYFYMDNFHFSQKGWVKLNEAIYEFYKKNQAE